jgi:hypothetical protein
MYRYWRRPASKCDLAAALAHDIQAALEGEIIADLVAAPMNTWRTEGSLTFAVSPNDVLVGTVLPSTDRPRLHDV